METGEPGRNYFLEILSSWTEGCEKPGQLSKTFFLTYLEGKCQLLLQACESGALCWRLEARESLEIFHCVLSQRGEWHLLPCSQSQCWPQALPPVSLGSRFGRSRGEWAHSLDFTQSAFSSPPPSPAPWILSLRLAALDRFAQWSSVLLFLVLQSISASPEWMEEKLLQIIGVWPTG